MTDSPGPPRPHHDALAELLGGIGLGAIPAPRRPLGAEDPSSSAPGGQPRSDASPPGGATRAGWPVRGARAVSLVVIGFLLAVAYHQMVDAGPSTNRARADLLAEARGRRDEADALQRRADALRLAVARERDAALSGDSGASSLRAVAAGAGLGKVVGAGVVIRVADGPAPIDPVTGRPSDENPGIVLDRDLQDIVNALWRLGAEAIAVGGQRVTSTTAIRAAGGAILVDYRPVTNPYEITAVGRDGLADRIRASATARRFRGYLATYRMRFEIKAQSRMTLPAAPERRLRYARSSPPAGGQTPSATPSSVRSGAGGTS